MSENRDLSFLGDWLEAASRIERYIAGMDHAAFLDDLKTQDAVVRNLEIIGEATKNISAELRDKHPYIPWPNMALLRDRLIHHYFGVNYDTIWSIISAELPKTYQQIQAVSEQLHDVKDTGEHHK